MKFVTARSPICDTLCKVMHMSHLLSQYSYCERQMTTPLLWRKMRKPSFCTHNAGVQVHRISLQRTDALPAIKGPFTVHGHAPTRLSPARKSFTSNQRRSVPLQPLHSTEDHDSGATWHRPRLSIALPRSKLSYQQGHPSDRSECRCTLSHSCAG